jgi:hypothetical protein
VGVGEGEELQVHAVRERACPGSIAPGLVGGLGLETETRPETTDDRAP